MKAISFLFFISIIVLVSLKEQEKPKNGVRGIDVSQYQGEIDWGTVASSDVNYAIIRATVRSGELVPNFEANYGGATGVGLPVAVYHLSYAKDNDFAAWEADTLIDKLK